MVIEHKINPYPRTMWVVIGEDFDKIKSEFEFAYESDLEMTDKKIVEECDAIVFGVYKGDKSGFLVFIVTKDSNRILVHEALHIALHVYEDCGMDLRPGMDQEPLCYLTEYIYSLIEEDIQKFKDECVYSLLKEDIQKCKASELVNND